MNRNVQPDIAQSNSPMRFTRHFLHYLAARPERLKRFRLGRWLQTLGDGELEQLRGLLGQYLDGGEDEYLDDLVALTVHCVAAERAKPGLDFKHGEIDEWIAVLYVSSAFESFRRRGWLVLQETLSIDPKNKVRCTVKGAWR